MSGANREHDYRKAQRWDFGLTTSVARTLRAGVEQEDHEGDT